MSPQRVKPTPITRTSIPLATRRRLQATTVPRSISKIPTRPNAAQMAPTPTTSRVGHLTFLERLKGKPGQTPIPKLRRQVDASTEVLVIRLERSGLL